jgi:hypothetical protein
MPSLRAKMNHHSSSVLAFNTDVCNRKRTYFRVVITAINPELGFDVCHAKCTL